VLVSSFPIGLGIGLAVSSLLMNLARRGELLSVLLLHEFVPNSQAFREELRSASRHLLQL
jgi:hypothetical protein